MDVCGVVSFVERLPIGDGETERLAAEECRQVDDALERQLQAGINHYEIIMDDYIGLTAAISLRMDELVFYNIHYTAVILWEEQAACWPEPTRDWWFRAFQECSKEIILESRLTEKNREKRDQYLLDHCHKLLLFTTGPSAEADALAGRAEAAGLAVERRALPWSRCGLTDWAAESKIKGGN